MTYHYKYKTLPEDKELHIEQQSTTCIARFFICNLQTIINNSSIKTDHILYDHTQNIHNFIFYM